MRGRVGVFAPAVPADFHEALDGLVPRGLHNDRRNVGVGLRRRIVHAVEEVEIPPRPVFAAYRNLGGLAVFRRKAQGFHRAVRTSEPEIDSVESDCARLGKGVLGGICGCGNVDKSVLDFGKLSRGARHDGNFAGPSLFHFQRRACIGARPRPQARPARHRAVRAEHDFRRGVRERKARKAIFEAAVGVRGAVDFQVVVVRGKLADGSSAPLFDARKRKAHDARLRRHERKLHLLPRGRVGVEVHGKQHMDCLAARAFRLVLPDGCRFRIAAQKREIGGDGNSRAAVPQRVALRRKRRAAMR